MSATSTWQYPPDLIEYATQKGVVAYLEPLREMTQRLFPTATRLSISREPDPELPDVTYIVFDVDVPIKDVPDYIEANHRWSAAQETICRSSLNCSFVLDLHRRDG